MEQGQPLSLIQVYRKGKRIILVHRCAESSVLGRQSSTWCLICGMGLAGWIQTSLEPPLPKHNIFTLWYTTGSLHFIDLRRFGSWYLMSGPLAQTWLQQSLGPDALTEPPEVLVPHLLAYQKRFGHREVKTVLLDQSLISGYGNIYACEACFRAGLSPWKKFRDCSEQSLRALLVQGRAILDIAVTQGGTSFRDFRSVDGEPGRMEPFLRVFRKKLCPRCQGPILREVLRGRGTYFCIHCQI